MGAGNSLYGGKTVMAGTYMAEQMSPEQCTLFSATSGGPKTKKVGAGGDPKEKRRQCVDIKDGAGCTILPALESIDPLLAKANPGDVQAPVKPRKGGQPQLEAVPKKSSRRRGAPSHAGEPSSDPASQVFNRLYYGASQFSAIEDVLDKSNEELVAWLSRPKHGEHTGKGISSFASTSHASSADSPGNSKNNSPRNHSREPSPSQQHGRSTRKAYKTYDELFAKALQGVNNTPVSRTKAYMPGKASQRLRPLVTQIQPICILPENAVEALKSSDRQHARAVQAIQSAKKGSATNKAVSKALGKFRNTNPIVEPDESTSSKPVADLLGSRLSNVVEQLRPEGNFEVKKEPDEGNIEVVSANAKMPQMRKEASEALRYFVFGGITIGKKTVEDKEHDRLLYAVVGSKSEVIALNNLWHKLDDDQSGRVNIVEFRAFASKTGAAVQKLSDKVMGPLLGKKSSFTIDDMMRIIWPCATLNDVKVMKRWIEEYHANVKLVKEPAIIKQEELEALIHNFKFFDQDSSGQVTFAELTESGLLDKDMADRYMQEWDDDGSGELDEMEFCEMFCIAGYRCCAEAKSATDTDGNRLVFEEGLGWHRRDEWEAFLKGVPLKQNKELIDVI